MRPLRSLLILLIVLLPASPFATTFPVTKTADTNDGVCDPDCSLREAIDAANTNPGADDVPVPAGFYLLTLGALIVTDDVTIAGAGQASTIIDRNAQGQALEIHPVVFAEISAVTIQNGRVTTQSTYGAGIYNNGGNLTLTDSTVSGNSGIRGGGIGSRGGNLTLIRSTVSGNDSTYGGGIKFVSFDGTLTLNNSTVSGNSAILGGGIDIRGYRLRVYDSTISGNSAEGGGGIRHSDAYTSFIHKSTVSGNSANLGGGILLVFSGSLSLRNSTVSGNSAEIGGGVAANGGSFFDRLSLSLSYSTVSENYASVSGGGIYSTASDFVEGSVNFNRSIVAGNTAPYPNLQNCDTGFIISVGYNLTDDTSCGFTEPGDLVVADAMLYPLGDFGGPTETHYPMIDSPAIDGTDSDICIATDQRGEARPFDGDGNGVAHCDIGAVEFVPEPESWPMLAAGALFLGAISRRRA